MKTSFTLSRIVLGAALIAGAVRPAVAAETVLKFSDPSKPGRLVVQVGFGDVTIVGEDTDEVRISSDDDVQSSTQPRDDGFRRLDGESGYSAGEANNVITVTFANVFPGKHGRRGGDTDVSIIVPRTTSLTIERGGPGDMEVRDLTGDVEIRGAIGDIELTGMGGGVLVESVNGDVEATFTALVADKPVSITVVNGDVEVTIPAASRANVEMRTLRGEMLTNFGEGELKTRFENTGIGSGGIDVNVDVNVEMGLAQAEKDRRQAEKDRKQAEKDRKQSEIDAARAAAAAAQSGRPGQPPTPPVPPMPPMPPMAGGKLVVGTLNGGGTALSIATITGDITLQKAE